MRCSLKPTNWAALALLVALSLILTFANAARPLEAEGSVPRARRLKSCIDSYKLCPSLASLCGKPEVASSCPCLCGVILPSIPSLSSLLANDASKLAIALK
ncbi:hypothetical protein V8C86DRAFT_2495201, partial [Haematococcus lacustris]